MLPASSPRTTSAIDKRQTRFVCVCVFCLIPFPDGWPTSRMDFGDCSTVPSPLLLLLLLDQSIPHVWRTTQSTRSQPIALFPTPIILLLCWPKLGKNPPKSYSHTRSKTSKTSLSGHSVKAESFNSHLDFVFVFLRCGSPDLFPSLLFKWKQKQEGKSPNGWAHSPVSLVVLFLFPFRQRISNGRLTYISIISASFFLISRR